MALTVLSKLGVRFNTPNAHSHFSENNHDGAGIVMLWRSVLHRALCDACYQFLDPYQMTKHSFAVAGPQRISVDNWRHADAARKFLLGDDQGFRDICFHADIDPGYMRRRAIAVIGEMEKRIKVIRPQFNAKQPEHRNTV